MSYVCLVCGYPGLEEQPTPEYGGCLYEICPCCSFQYGYTDASEGISISQWRQQWIAGGMVFDEGDSSPPSGWDPVAQLRGIGVVV